MRRCGKKSTTVLNLKDRLSASPTIINSDKALVYNYTLRPDTPTVRSTCQSSQREDISKQVTVILYFLWFFLLVRVFCRFVYQNSINPRPLLPLPLIRCT